MSMNEMSKILHLLLKHPARVSRSWNFWQVVARARRGQRREQQGGEDEECGLIHGVFLWMDLWLKSLEVARAMTRP